MPKFSKTPEDTLFFSKATEAMWFSRDGRGRVEGKTGCKHSIQAVR